VVFSNPAFVKKIPAAQKADYMFARLFRPGCKIFANDFVALEASYQRAISFAIAFVVYKYIMQAIPGFWQFMERYVQSVCGMQKLRNFYIVAWIICKLMSGEMDTSTRNGLTNFAVLEFLAWLNRSHYLSAIEGDDSANTVVSGVAPTCEQFRAVGFDVKLEFPECLEEMSFCGMVFDTEDRAIVANPLKVLAEVGLMEPKYQHAGRKLRQQLMRSKGYSYCHQYSGAPIIQSLGECILRLTADTDMSDFLQKRIHFQDTYHYEQMCEYLASLDVPVKPIGNRTRNLVARLYGFSVERQLMIEDYLAALGGDILEIELPSWMIEDLAPKEWKDYGERFQVMHYGDRKAEQQHLLSNSRKEVTVDEIVAAHAPEPQEDPLAEIEFNLYGMTYDGDVKRGEELLRAL